MSATMDLLTAAKAINGELLGNNLVFSGVSTDSRKISAGELFVALRGDNFDGHRFVDVAQASGATAALVANDTTKELRSLGLPLITVSDTRLALGALAAGWRQRYTGPLIAVTGSNGKTTTKEMIASIFKAAFGDAVLSTQGNFNNDIGLPLTLLKLNPIHRAAVVEMGMNHPGEIAYLAGIASPTIALVTNVQRAHLAGMGTLDAIAREKGSIYESLGDAGVAVFNAHDEWAEIWRKQSGKHRSLTYAMDDSAEVCGSCSVRGLETRVTISYCGEQIDLNLPLPGQHNARNATAAAAATLAAGVPLTAVREGLAGFSGTKGRLQRRAGINGADLLDDSYNANPDSVRAGIDVLAATVGKKILVLGDMGELGWMAAQFHDEIGGYAKSQGVDHLLTLGESSQLAARNFGAGGRHFKKIDDLILALTTELSTRTTVLIKGSRFMRMERVVEAISQTTAAQATENK